MPRDAAPTLALRLTALTLLLRPMGPWDVRPSILMVAAAALLFPRVLASQATWYVLAALVAVRYVTTWFLVLVYSEVPWAGAALDLIGNAT